MSENRRILLDSRMRGFSGIGTYIRNMEKELQKLGAPLESLEFSSKVYSPLEQFERARYLRKRKEDLFWTPHFNIPVLASNKQIATIHDCYHLAHKNDIPRSHYYYARFLFSQVKRKCSKIIVDSKFTAGELYRLTGIPYSKMEVIYLGVDELFFTPSTISKKAQKPFIHFVGNLKPNKNLHSLLEAFKKVMSKVPYDLYIIGQKDGFRTPAFNCEAIEKEFDSRVKFLGRLSEEELKWHNQNSLGLFFPSTYEGFGFPPLEAMASGCPVYCSNTSSLGELYNDIATTFRPDVNGIYQALLKVSEKRSDGKDEMRNFAARFTWNKTARRSLEVINSI